MKTIFYYLFLFINVFLAIKYSYRTVDVLLLVVTCVLSYVYFRRLKNIKDNILTLFLIIYILLAVHVVALLELSSIGFFKDVIVYKEYAALAIWGNRLYFVLFVTLSLCNRHLFRKGVSVYKKPTSRNSTEGTFIIITFVTYFLSVISALWGVSDLTGAPKVVLPFHLNGLIDEFRSNVYPFIFAIYVFDCLSQKSVVHRKIIVLFLIYVLAEVFVRSSKGAFLYSFLPVLELLAFMGYLYGKKAIKLVVPQVLVFLFLYPIVESARMEGSVTIESLQEASKAERSNQGEEHSSPYIRAFLTGVYYTKMVDIVSDNHLEFDLRRVPVLIAMPSGGVSYMTNVIDGVPEGSNQSSGVTGLCDALLWGGYPLCYIVLAFLVMLCYWGDRKYYMRNTPLYKVILFYIIYRLVLGRTISAATDTWLFAMVGSSSIKLFLTKYYYKYYY